MRKTLDIVLLYQIYTASGDQQSSWESISWQSDEYELPIHAGLWEISLRVVTTAIDMENGWMVKQEYTQSSTI